MDTEVDVNMLATMNYRHIVIASGVVPRPWAIEGSDRKEVVSYLDVLKNRVEVDERVAIIGAGGIGFDVADYLSHDADECGFSDSWGLTKTLMEEED